MKSAVKTWARVTVEPIVGLLHALKLTPNHITLFGTALSGVAGWLVSEGHFIYATLTLGVGGLCDMLDGALARKYGTSSTFGAFLDSSMDRLAELFFFVGVAIFFHQAEPSSLYIALAILAAGGSFLVSYTRARAEGLGIDCSVGLMERPERIVIILLATPFGALGLKVMLWILTPLVFFTVWQRIHHVQRATQNDG
ncbi:MAG: CDP-alcohol phosphatidyltransferase family protein [Candidatus Eisenbacteria bacterium]|uniref:CDP-alcohol phosphatidyltransferase family protein n=1 Tax=Eiseniibacteriota bacterium TaxID=2212470 RepID=A0A7Y2E756_UNCEI|nr:CDP-alcohol phosphatidyltransferase family protein [Candidatus Eisenbacteria bacterium]